MGLTERFDFSLKGPLQKAVHTTSSKAMGEEIHKSG